MIYETFREAVKNIWSNKFRTVLTMLGIIIGVTAVIVIVGLGNGMTQSIKDSFSEMGTNVHSVQITGRGSRTVTVQQMYDIVDSHPEATGGFAGPAREHALRVEFPETLLQAVPERAREALKALLAQDPRPSYQHDPERLYGLPFAGVDVRFTVDGDTLTVRAVEKYRPEQDASEAE